MEVIAALLGFVFFLIIIGLVLGIYFAPSIVAKVRKQKDIMSIFLLNLFLGWSLIGWVVSLVWATKKA